MKKNLLKNSAVQTLVASLICIVLALLVAKPVMKILQAK